MNRADSPETVAAADPRIQIMGRHVAEADGAAFQPGRRPGVPPGLVDGAGDGVEGAEEAEHREEASREWAVEGGQWGVAAVTSCKSAISECEKGEEWPHCRLRSCPSRTRSAAVRIQRM